MNRIVIIGGGFAGLMAARTLRRHGQSNVTLIERISLDLPVGLRKAAE
jgi:glycine/D-amino acid oxidase-like deaminating enzyme